MYIARVFKYSPYPWFKEVSIRFNEKEACLQNGLRKRY
jgi:hypothetical protein